MADIFLLYVHPLGCVPRDSLCSQAGVPNLFIGNRPDALTIAKGYDARRFPNSEGGDGPEALHK